MTSSNFLKVFHNKGKLHTAELVKIAKVSLSPFFSYSQREHSFRVINTEQRMRTTYNRQEPTLFKDVEAFLNEGGGAVLEKIGNNSSDKKKRLTAFLVLNALDVLKNNKTIIDENNQPVKPHPYELWSISSKRVKKIIGKEVSKWSSFDYIQVAAWLDYKNGKGKSKKTLLSCAANSVNNYKRFNQSQVTYRRPCNSDGMGYAEQSERMVHPQGNDQEQAYLKEIETKYLQHQRSMIMQKRQNELLKRQEAREHQARVHQARVHHGKLKTIQSEIDRVNNRDFSLLTTQDKTELREYSLDLLKKAMFHANVLMGLDPSYEEKCSGIISSIKTLLWEKYGNEIRLTPIFRQKINGEVLPVPVNRSPELLQYQERKSQGLDISIERSVSFSDKQEGAVGGAEIERGQIRPRYQRNEAPRNRCRSKDTRSSALNFAVERETIHFEAEDEEAEYSGGQWVYRL